MAIGSEGEIGVKFKSWGQKTPEERDEWSSTFRDRFGDNLLKGYAILAYPKRYENGDIDGNTQEETHMRDTTQTDSEG